MNLFQMKLGFYGVGRMKEFLKDNFVSMGWPGLGNLEDISKDELEQRLAEARLYNYEGQEWSERLTEVSSFVHEMQDGDYILIADEDWVHLGDLGDYYYIDQFDSTEDGTCHRRGVTWLKSLPREELHTELQRFLDEQEMITKFKRAVTLQEVERWMSNSIEAIEEPCHLKLVEEKTIEEALNILKIAMQSEEVERRERAAIAILQYAKR